MLGLALREICGPLIDFFSKLVGPNGPEWWAAFKKFLRKENPWFVEPLLTFFGTVSVQLPAKFIAADHFEVNTARGASVQIAYVSENFKAWFFGKIEEFSKSVTVTLRYHSLNKNSVDGPIIAELGGEEKVKTGLAAIFALMEQQPNGEQGALSTSGFANIFYVFYVRGTNKTLRAVSVRWSGVGWRVCSYPKEKSLEWGAGCRVFSR